MTGGTRLGLHRTHRPSRGGAGLETSGACVRGEKGSALPRGSTHDKEVRGSVREGDSAPERGRETFARVGPVRAVSSSRSAPSGSSPVHVPARGRPKANAREGSSPLAAVEETTRSRQCPCIVVFAEVGRTPSGSEKRATGIPWVESPPGATERVNGGLATNGNHPRRASAAGRSERTEGGSSESDDPHHVSVRRSAKAA
jgi:hypothetical protein